MSEQKPQETKATDSGAVSTTTAPTKQTTVNPSKVDFSKPDETSTTDAKAPEETSNENTGDTNDGVDNTQELQANELEGLKARAKQMGLTFHPSIGLETLREKINLKLRTTGVKDVEIEPGVPKLNEVNSDEEVTEYSAKEIKDGYAERDTSKLSKAQLRNEAIREANKLVRVRVVNMNPNKREWTGEVITVSNSVVGTFRKFVSFNNPAGYHIPQIILQALKERDCQIFVTGISENGQRIKKATLIKEFAIEILPPLTMEELKDLAQRQAMANGANR